MSYPTKLELNLISGLSANVLKLLDQSEVRKWHGMGDQELLSPGEYLDEKKINPTSISWVYGIEWVNFSPG